MVSVNPGSPLGGFEFNPRVWEPALLKFSAVTGLTVILYNASAAAVCGPTPSSALFALFEEYGYDPKLFADCASLCLAGSQSPVILAPSYGLAVVGVPLRLEGTVVAA